MKNERNANKTILILNIIIVLLGIACVCMGVGIIKEFGEETSGYEVDSDFYIWALEEGDYNRLLNYASGDSHISQEEEAYVAIAGYYSDAFMYKACREVGNNTKAEVLKERMDDYVKQMGDLAFEKDHVDAFLQLEE